MAGEGAGALAGDEHAVVGIAAHLTSHTHVFDEEADVAYGVVFALACGAHDGNVALTLGVEVLHGFGLVVGLLVGVVVDERCIVLAVLVAERVAIYDDETNTDKEGGCQLSNGLRFSFGGSTGVERTTVNGRQTTVIYDLQGRKVADTEGLSIL